MLLHNKPQARIKDKSCVRWLANITSCQIFNDMELYNWVLLIFQKFAIMPLVLGLTRVTSMLTEWIKNIHDK